jgi:hypothetical protein
MLHLSNYKINKNLYEQYIKFLINQFYNFNKKYNVVINNLYLTYKSFYPLPTTLVTEDYTLDNKIAKVDNTYYLEGKPGIIRILFADRFIPHNDTDPIPFTFPVIINNQIELLNSCVYYYEVTILENMLEPWSNETISIGYGTTDIPINTNPGWMSNSFAYYLADGTFQYNQLLIKNVGPSCKTNDTFGAGIIYLDLNTYKPFFTYNGSLIIIDQIENIVSKNRLVPIIGFNYSNKIKVNFSNEEFKFNIKDYLYNNKIISSKNIFLNLNNYINYINTRHIIKNKLFSKINHVPMFSFTDMVIGIINQNS